MKLSPSSVVVATSDHVSSDLGGELAILDLKHWMYYGLESVGARIWILIQTPRTIGEIRDTIVREYEVEPGRCERDLTALLEELAKWKLIEVQGERVA